MRVTQEVAGEEQQQRHAQEKIVEARPQEPGLDQPVSHQQPGAMSFQERPRAIPEGRIAGKQAQRHEKSFRPVRRKDAQEACQNQRAGPIRKSDFLDAVELMVRRGVPVKEQVFRNKCGVNMRGPILRHQMGNTPRDVNLESQNRHREYSQKPHKGIEYTP